MPGAVQTLPMSEESKVREELGGDIARLYRGLHTFREPAEHLHLRLTRRPPRRGGLPPVAASACRWG